MLTLNVVSNTTLTNLSRSPPQEIRMDQVPTQSRWRLVPLYKSSVSGDLLFWQIGFDGIDHLELSHGYEGGIIRTDRTEVKTNNSGRNIIEQALLEARHRYKLKYHEGYQPAGATTAPLVKGMKGYEYKQNSVKNWPVYTQPKLNGIRMLCQHSHNGLSMRSWLNNSYTHLHHIENELRDFFSYLPRYSTLDGELYNHSMDFTELISAVKTVKSVHPKLHDVQYWIFDINYEDCDGAPFEKRCLLLHNAYRQYIQDLQADSRPVPSTFTIVPTSVASNHEEVIQQHNLHVASGYEGIMIKKISNGYSQDTREYKQSLYRSGKSNHILKYKEFIDEEAVVVGVTEAEGTEKGAAILEVVDKRGNRFPIRMRGDFNRRRYWFQNPHVVMGKEVTIRYQELSIYGVPRFPVGVAIRDYE